MSDDLLSGLFAALTRCSTCGWYVARAAHTQERCAELQETIETIKREQRCIRTHTDGELVL